MSDTTASAPGSDDEIGSNAATDGSTLRTSPADHGGSAGSESAGSAEESILGDPNGELLIFCLLMNSSIWIDTYIVY